MTDVRTYVVELLDAWESGTRAPREVFAEARASWLSGRWPKPYARGYDPGGMDVLFVLSRAREEGLDDADIPALREYVAESRLDRAQEPFFAHWQGIGRAAREALAERADYYGPPPDDGIDDMESTLTDPDDRRLHRLIRTDPEAGWDDLRARLCAPPPRDEDLLYDLVEDLMFHHPDAFINRIEAVVAECPSAREPVVRAYVDGRTSTPGLERFWALQERLRG